MISKVLRRIGSILRVVFSRQFLVCMAELRRVARAPVLTRAWSSRLWTTDLPTDDRPHNGSIVRSGEGWLVAVRTANVYHSRMLRRLEIKGGPSQVNSRTWLVRLSEDFNVLDRILLPDEPLRDPNGLAKNGLTDPRLFSWKGQIWALWSAERVVGNDWSDLTNTMLLGRLDDGQINDPLFLPSPHGFRREKNWMPWPVGDALRFVYSPEHMEVYEFSEQTLHLVGKRASPDPRLRGYSGSSQILPWGEQWICVVHYAARAIRAVSAQLLPSFYLHRFVVLSTDLEIKAVSPEFFLEEKGTEFCAGLVVTEQSVVLSYGLNDEMSRVAELPRERVETFLEPKPD